MASDERFGPYRLDELIGRGGMGEVYRAYDTVRKRTVALKRLPKHLAADRAYKSRFRREAELAARLSEPHIVPIHDYGEIDGELFIDMRLIVGTDLATLIEDVGPLPPARAVAIVGQVAAALAAAHAEGLTHRDVKPSNVLISGDGHDNDFAHLVDFGIAHHGAATSMTETGTLVGTLEYMAPERLLNEPSDHRADIYALGCVLYEALTAQKPFPAGTIAAQMYGHVHTPPPQPSDSRPELPSGFDVVTTRAMAKNPDHRFQRIAELSTAAYEAVAQSAVGHQPGAKPGRGVDPAVAASPVRSTDPVGTVPHPHPQPEPWPVLPTASPARGRRLLIPTIVAAATAVGAGAALIVGGGHAATSQRGADVAPTVAAEIRAGADTADVAVSPDGRHAYITGRVPTASVVYDLDTATNRISAPIPVPAGTARVAVTPDGAHAYITNNVATNGNGDGTVSVVDLNTRAVVATIPVDKPADVAITADGSRVFVTENADSGAVAVINAATNTVAATVAVGAKPDGVALTPDGRNAYVTSQNSNNVAIIDTARNAVVATVPTGGNPIGVAISPDGRRAYIANREPQGSVTVLDTLTHAVVATVPVGSDPIRVAISPDGRRAYVTDFQGNTVSVIDIATNAVTHTIQVGGNPNGIAISPDGRWAYTANQEPNTVSVINTGTG